jgi:hypothetical protein
MPSGAAPPSSKVTSPASADSITSWRCLDAVSKLHERGEITFVGSALQTRFDEVLGVVRATDGALNVNGALLVVLQRDGEVGDLASFDTDFDAVEGFQRRG